MEPLADLDARVFRTIEQLAGDHDVMVAVTHDAILQSALWQFDPDRVGSRDEVPQPTGCWNRLDADGSWRIRVVGAMRGDGRTPA